MPWLPELFSAPVLERAREKWELERLDAVPYYVGLMSGEHEALRSDGRLMELRIYHSIWALTGHHLHRPPLL